MNEEILEKKSNLRKEMLLQRAQIPFELKQEYDRSINKQLQELIAKHQVRVLHCYLPMGAEIDITPTIEFALDNQIKIISPKTLPKRQLENRVLTSINAIEKGIWGTSHPKGEPYSGPIDMIIVPGLAIDPLQYRLGYGGGYYDNFLSQYPDAHTWGIFYPEQKVASVPREPHDVRLKSILFPEVS